MADDVSQEASKALEGGKQLASKTAGFVAKRFNPISMTGLPLTIGIGAITIGSVAVFAPAALAPLTLTPGAGAGANAIAIAKVGASNFLSSVSTIAQGAGTMVLDANYAAAGEALGNLGDAILNEDVTRTFGEGVGEMASQGGAETASNATMNTVPSEGGSSLMNGGGMGASADASGVAGKIGFAEPPNLAAA